MAQQGYDKDGFYIIQSHRHVYKLYEESGLYVCQNNNCSKIKGAKY